MKLNKTILAVTAIVLPLTLGIGSSLAYFTARDASTGGHPIEAGAPGTDITEEFGQWTKHVTIENTGDVPVYVRVKAFSGSEYKLSYTLGNGWELKNDGYYYYNPILTAEGDTKKTTSLDIKINNVPEDATADAFNVIVVYERTPVQYDKDGKAYADWDNYTVTQESGITFESEGGKE